MGNINKGRGVNIGRKILQSAYDTYINWGEDPAQEPDDGSGGFFSTLLYILFIGVIGIAVIALIALLVVGAYFLYKKKFAKKKVADTNYVLMENDMH